MNKPYAKKPYNSKHTTLTRHEFDHFCAFGHYLDVFRISPKEDRFWFVVD